MKHRVRRSRALLCGACAVFAAAACQDGTAPVTVVPPELNIIQGGGTDSVMASVAVLVVEVRGNDGEPVTGTHVEFRSLGSTGSPHVNLSGPTDLPRGVLNLPTDAAGRASAPVRLGSVAGTAQVLVTVPVLGLSDTVAYTVLPGAADTVVLLPADTAVYAGAAYAVRATVQDRFGNPRTDAVTLQSATPGVVAAGGGTVTAVAIGRGTVTASAAGATSKAHVSVVPRGTLAAYGGSDPTASFTVANLDGSGVRSIRVAGGPEGVGIPVGSGPEWIPGRDEIAFYHGHRELKLWAVDFQGTSRLLLADSGMHVGSPRFSPDGAWMYYNRSDVFGLPGQVWRARPDGTGAERLTPDQAEYYDSHFEPSPAPDGARVVYRTRRFPAGGDSPPELTVMDLATRQARGLGLPGYAPDWSPDGDLIAYQYENRIRVVRPDGTGARIVSPEGLPFVAELAWSPDGEWIAAVAVGARFYLYLIHVESGLALPVPFAHGLREPSWRR